MEYPLPVLSIIVIAHAMRRQAMNTLYSLCPDYQQDVYPASYEVLVMENESDNNLDADDVSALGDNFRYFLRSEEGVSPAPAINEALGLCRGRYVGLLIDGARMLTPRVLKYALQALHIPGAVVAVPGYYLTGVGKLGDDERESLDYERAYLERSDWRRQGYNLFSEACFSNGNRNGFLDPLMECNALFVERSSLLELGGADERFNLRGGGALNLHLYRQVATLPESRLFILAGEGNFHQFHGGTSTRSGSDRDALVQTFKSQLDSFWPGGFKSVSREPTLFGAVTEPAMRFLQQSLDSGLLRFKRLRGAGRDPWEDDTRAGGNR